MASEKDKRRSGKLAQMYENLVQSPIPRAQGLEMQDADIDLYEEDGYLAGLVDTYLSVGRKPNSEVCLDDSLDRRLWSIQASGRDEEMIKSAFLKYRRKMRELTDALNEELSDSM